MGFWQLKVCESLTFEGEKLVGPQLRQLFAIVKLRRAEVDDLRVAPKILCPCRQLAPLLNLLGSCHLSLVFKFKLLRSLFI